MGFTSRFSAFFFLGCLVFTVIPLPADPPEDVNAWPDAPIGFHWDLLGPHTEPVDASAYDHILHVSPAGSDRTGDGSANRPWAGIRRALRHGETAHREGRTAILVAEGHYEEGELELAPRVDLFGGFDPATWTRDIHRYPSILSGGGRNRVLIAADDARIDGLVVEHGVSRAPGGGLYCHRVSPVITNNVFRFNRTLEPEDFSHDPIRKRQLGHDGGAIGLVEDANPDIRHNLFLFNETEIGDGAAIGARDDCIPRIGFNLFWGNRAGVNDVHNTRTGNGGAIALTNSSRAAILHNLFVANEALHRSDGGAIFSTYFSWPEIRNNAFLGNFADDDGGAIDAHKLSYPKIRSNLFYGNRSNGAGGAVFHDDAPMILENNIMVHNSAGGIAGAFGGSHGWFRAVNNTIVFNHADRGGGGVLFRNQKSRFYRFPILQNNILHGNTPDQLVTQTPVSVFYNIIEGGFPAYGSYSVDPGFRDNGKALIIERIATDPTTFTTLLTVRSRLVPGELRHRILRIDEQWTMVRDNSSTALEAWGLLDAHPGADAEILPTYHLAPDSPSINRGLYQNFAPTDIDGEPRFEPTIDVGADEYHPDTFPETE